MELLHDYFIIESLSENDINDGKIFNDTLLSLGKYKPFYIKVYNKKEFENALLDFSNSNYKYLFISGFILYTVGFAYAIQTHHDSVTFAIAPMLNEKPEPYVETWLSNKISLTVG